jgi:hypothetical protein
LCRPQKSPALKDHFPSSISPIYWKYEPISSWKCCCYSSSTEKETEMEKNDVISPRLPSQPGSNQDRVLKQVKWYHRVCIILLCLE